MRGSQLWAAAVVAVGVTVAACSGGSKPPTVPTAGSQSTVPTAGSQSTTTAAQAGGSSDTELASLLAYAQCMRSHGVPNWPDPVATPSGGYGFRTNGINPQSPAFKSAGQACKALDTWGSTGQQLSPAQQQEWLNWAKCIRSHGVPDFADPKFSGSEVHVSGGGGSSSPQLQSAMDACKSQMPSTGGLGG